MTSGATWLSHLTITGAVSRELHLKTSGAESRLMRHQSKACACLQKSPGAVPKRAIWRRDFNCTIRGVR